ncbi:2OG-Fe(II) oxygenase [Streptomyces kronopolitis]|uniref:2OG-Fe(II) oxygenase n=1 Tax=Streptomyces kronopolitis TaxID=1612435 RepID=UPI00368AAA76
MTSEATMARSDTTVEASEAPSLVSMDALWRLPVTVCRISNFLGERASGALLERAIASASGALPPSTVRVNREVDPAMRRSRSDGDFAVPELLSAIEDVREAVEQTLGVSCEGTEPSYGLNVHNDGDFYLPHQDTGPGPAAQRLLTFVYYLHRTPRPFQGGHLRVFDVVLPVHTEGSVSWEDRTWRDWEPEHDSIVFFRPTAWHEVRKVSCPTKEPADSRFAVNGWLCRPEIPNPR